MAASRAAVNPSPGHRAMTPHRLRKICARCKLVLPRAALNRCPRCLAPVAPPSAAAGMLCRLCGRPLPRAHAGNCPACAAAAMHAGRTHEIGGPRE